MSFYSDSTSGNEEEEEGLTTGEPVSFMCLPCSITASCFSSPNHTTASLTFSKVVLTAEETRVYQIPWEKQQKKLRKSKQKSLCFCWCCVCTCLCKPVNNRLSRRVSMTSHDLKRRTACYKHLVEQNKPSVEQLQRWTVDFEDLLRNELGRKLFYLFLQQEHSEENLQFWNEVNTLREMADTKEKSCKMKTIYKEFIKPMALKEVNIAGNTRRQIEENMESKPNEKMFDAAQNQVFLMMHRQSYPNFLKSDLFHAVMQTTYAYNPNSPKPVSSSNPSMKNNKDHQQQPQPQQPPQLEQQQEQQPQQQPQPQQEKHLQQESQQEEQPKQPKRPVSLHPALDSTVQHLDRHNSMPLTSKAQHQLQRERMESKLTARNSSKT